MCVPFSCANNSSVRVLVVKVFLYTLLIIHCCHSLNGRKKFCINYCWQNDRKKIKGSSYVFVLTVVAYGMYHVYLSVRVIQSFNLLSGVSPRSQFIVCNLHAVIIHCDGSQKENVKFFIIIKPLGFLSCCFLSKI